MCKIKIPGVPTFSFAVPDAVTADLKDLISSARQRQKQAFQPGTHSNHRTYIRTYLAFCSFYKLQDISPAPATICLYIEFLARAFSSPKAIMNYVHGVKFLHKLVDQPATALTSFQVELSLRALKVTMPQLPKQRKPITVEMLQILCALCGRCCGNLSRVVKCALLFAFFGFLRCSSLAPPNQSAFDPTRHICRGDILMEHPGLLILIKWSKTRQDKSHMHLLPLPSLASHALCPVSAYKDMVAHQPAPPNSPLLQHPRGAPVTTSTLRKLLITLLQSAGFSSLHHSFHSLRRGGATFSYQIGLDLQNIKAHGDWRSDAVHSYVESHFGDPTLPLAMAQAVAGLSV